MWPPQLPPSASRIKLSTEISCSRRILMLCQHFRRSALTFLDASQKMNTGIRLCGPPTKDWTPLRCPASPFTSSPGGYWHWVREGNWESSEKQTEASDVADCGKLKHLTCYYQLALPEKRWLCNCFVESQSGAVFLTGSHILKYVWQY